MELDAVEVRLARLEVVGIAHQPDAVELLERFQLERPGADRLGAHLRPRDVAGVDRRESRGQQGQQRRLRMVEMDGDFVVAAAVHVVDVAVPAAARVLAQLVARPAGQQVEGAFDVACREQPAVVPLHAVAQLEGELGLVFVPAPRLGEIGQDRLVAVLRHARIEHDEVVEYRHERHDGRGTALLVDRGAGRIVAMEHAQDAAALLRVRRVAQAKQHDCDAGDQKPRIPVPRLHFGPEVAQSRGWPAVDTFIQAHRIPVGITNIR